MVLVMGLVEASLHGPHVRLRRALLGYQLLNVSSGVVTNSCDQR